MQCYLDRIGVLECAPAMTPNNDKPRQTVLVTGAAGGQHGRTGRRVTELLRARGVPVRAMVRTLDERADHLRGLGAEAWSRRGVASDNEVTVRALVYIIAGHEAHHVQILRTRYL